MKKYAKALVALAALVAVVGQALADGAVSGTEWGLIVTAGAAVIGVFTVKNKPSA